MGDKSPVLVVEKARFFVNRVSEGLSGLPAPLVLAKLYNIVFALAVRIAAIDPGALDETLRILEDGGDEIPDDPVPF